MPYPHDKEGTTTGDVAGYLERRYHPIEVFYNENAEAIQGQIVEGYGDALESLLMGAPAQDFETVLNAGTSGVEKLFHQFLESGEIEKLGMPGAPTKAAVARKSGRFKKGKAKRARPSLIDTGLYDSSFKAWVQYDPMGFFSYGAVMADALGDF